MADDGNLDEAKGRAKEAIGDVTGDESLEGEGKVDRAEGGVKSAVSGIADRIKGLFRRA